MKGYRKLGEYIQQVDVRNTDLSVTHLLGVSVEKRFIESIGNTIGTDFSKYKIVKKGKKMSTNYRKTGNKNITRMHKPRKRCVK